jgi:hypothetical protein
MNEIREMHDFFGEVVRQRQEEGRRDSACAEEGLRFQNCLPTKVRVFRTVCSLQ